MVRSDLRGETCGYCSACVRARLSAARGRSPEPLECAYKHILESYTSEKPGKLPDSPKPACASCRWTSNAQFPETPPQSASDFSLEWSSRSSQRSRTRRRKR
ncbi:Flagellar FliJ protein [Operophtera brumata]|uniref:Flagellar FliJ protein n=1 Tax=Operophtera brumata TaxID=104452 RepID=A0A0L7LD08_OPEBR|nr:Flagellar FliJ protein [Operophtera brumata]